MALRQLKALLAPYPSAGMTCWPVSTRVGNVKNSDPSLIERVSSWGAARSLTLTIAGEVCSTLRFPPAVSLQTFGS